MFPSWSAPATAARAASWSMRASCCRAEYRGAVLEVDAGTRQVNLFPADPQGSRVPDRVQGLPCRRRPVVPAGRCLHGARWLGVRGRLVRRGRRRPCLQRPDDRPDLSRRASGPQEPEDQGRLGDERRTDRGAQVAEHRHSRCRAAGFDRAGASSSRAGLPAVRRSSRATKRIEALMKLAEPGNKDIDRARAAWTLHGIAISVQRRRLNRRSSS